MGSYDSPGFQDRTPGGPVTQSTGAPGSSPGPFPATDSITGALSAGTGPGRAVVTIAGASLANADVVSVGPLDTLVPAQANSYGPAPDPLTGAGAGQGVTGAGTGHVRGPGHPNSAFGTGPEV